MPVKKETLDDLSTLSTELKDEILETLLMWVYTSDHMFSLYSYLANIREIKELACFEYDEHRAKFEKLFHDELKEGGDDLVKFFEKLYQEIKEEYEACKISAR